MREPRILLVRPDHLGDVLLTLPAAVALKRAVPSAHLTYLVASGLEAVPERCPAVDGTLSLPYPSPDGAFDEKTWSETVAAHAPALRDRFDVAVLLRPNDPWSGSVVTAAGIPARVGFDTGPMNAFLTDRVPELSRRHAVLLALDVMTAALHRVTCGSISPSNAPPLSSGDRAFVPFPQDEWEAERAIQAVAPDVGGRPVILHPGTGWRLKNWPAERWGKLATALQRRLGVPPVVTGTHAERVLVREVVTHSNGSAVSLPRPLALGGFAALLARASLLVASDSGPLHLAALLGTPVVGLYGPGDPSLAAPWSSPETHEVVRIDLPCSPCGVMHDPPCGAVTDPACVTGVTVEAVLEAATAVWAGVP